MRQVDLGQCPTCGVVIMKWLEGPNGLAMHDCVPPPPTALELVELAANDPNLTLEDAAIAGCRAMLYGASRGDAFDARGYGELIAGVSKHKTAGGDADNELLLKFFGNNEVADEVQPDEQ